MNSQELTNRLLALSSPGVQQELLESHPMLLSDDLVAAVKHEADQLLGIDPMRSLHAGELLGQIAARSSIPAHEALALLAQANACNIGLARYEHSIALYDRAADIYRSQNQEVEAATAQIGKLYALANLGRYDEAIAAGEWAGHVLREHGQWLRLAKLTSNLAITYGRRGEDAVALELFDRALELYRRLDLGDSPYAARLCFSRAIVLRNLGRFEESIQASHRAIELAGYSDQRVDQTRSRQSLAVTYFVLGRYNEALGLLYQVRVAFVADKRKRDVILVDLFISDCLLHLRRFRDVLEKCDEVRQQFRELGSQLEVAQAWLNQAEAFAGLNQPQQGLESLSEARAIFEAEGNRTGALSVDLQRSLLLLRENQTRASFELAQTCSEAFRQAGLPVREAQAQLVSARAAWQMGDEHLADVLVKAAAATALAYDIPELAYQSQHLQGRLALDRDDTAAAFVAYDSAIRQLERLSGRLMIEHRASFLEDKDVLYGDMVFLCLDQELPARGLEYAERAKSRALLDLLAFRLDLSIRARSPHDETIVQELDLLRAERDRIGRRRESKEEVGLRGDSGSASDQVLVLEKRITELWHELLVRNADYARDAALWQVRSESIQPLLDPATVLVEYFQAHEELIAFVVTSTSVTAQRLPVKLDEIQHQASRLWLNLRATPRSKASQIPALTQNAKRLLRQLYKLLIEPIDGMLVGYRRVIIVPHGSLHYLPFHAFFDGEEYLLQRFELSYLPSSSFLRYCQSPSTAASGLAAFGYTMEGRLPFAADEADAIAKLVGGEPFVEDHATLANLRRTAASARILHLATHAEARPDSPLFSGLALADGWLTTLDVFNLRLQASLVTLSACQTGQSVVGGGDELLGLMRAFLYAGASSLILTLWSVEDASTATLMRRFYSKLIEGYPKAAALRAAQLEIMSQASDDGALAVWQHPYYWAAFFLVGDSDQL